MKIWKPRAKAQGSASGSRGDCAPCNGKGGMTHGGRWVKCARCQGTGSEPS